MAALPKPQTHAAPPPRAGDWEAMVDPVHPMHRELLRRVSEGSDPSPYDDSERWSGPARLAVAFYLGLASWAVIISSVMLLSRLT